MLVEEGEGEIFAVVFEKVSMILVRIASPVRCEWISGRSLVSIPSLRRINTLRNWVVGESGSKSWSSGRIGCDSVKKEDGLESS